MDSSEFFGGADPAPGLDSDKDGYGRYLLDATGTGKTPFTRATTIAKMLDNTNGLEKWQRKVAARGVAMRPDLVARAAVTPLDDARSWKEILQTADEVGSPGVAKGHTGSAFHTFHEHVANMSDAEYAAVPHELRVTYERYRAELDRLGIEEVLTEVTVANTEIGVAGKLDAVFRLADGRLVVGDRKTGNVVKYPHAACVQLATYANADVLIEYDENGATVRHPMPELDKTMALVVDITIGNENTAAVHVYELDIWSGWAAALLSVKIRAWRNRRDLVTPYHPDPFTPRIDPATPWAPGQTVRAVAADPIETTPVAQHILVSREMLGYQTGDGPVIDVAEAAPGSVYTDGTPGGFHSPDDVPRATPEQRAEFAAELPPPSTRFPVEVAHGPGANVSPTAAAVLGTGPAVGTGDAIQPPHVGTHPAWSSKEQAVIALDSKGERVPDPSGLGIPELQAADVDALLAAFKTKAQLQAVLAKVDPGARLARTRANLAKDAVSHPTWPQRRAEFLAMDDGEPDGRVATPEEFSATVSNAPGPVPPDPEPRYSSINPFAPTPDPDPAPFEPVAELAEPIEDQLLRKIGEAASSDDLAAIWYEAHDAGIGWPARLHQAALIRQKHLTPAPAAQ